MQNCNGSGYGIAMYWRNTMKYIANESGEACQCWHNEEPLIQFIAPELNHDCTEINHFKISVQCQSKECKSNFPETEIELMKTIKTFYKV